MSPSIRLALIWILFAAGRIGLVLLLARGRLKPRPTLLLFVAVEIAYFLTYRATILFGHWETALQIAFACVCLFGFGIIHAIVLWIAGHSRSFLLMDPSNRATFYRAFLMVPTTIFLSLVQFSMVCDCMKRCPMSLSPLIPGAAVSGERDVLKEGQPSGPARNP